ncbi:MAG: hypothetical protein LBL66_01515 [Clostridiales bacterium]|nr:hypothetical protein [Clostridiales bacterium]
MGCRALLARGQSIKSVEILHGKQNDRTLRKRTKYYAHNVGDFSTTLEMTWVCAHVRVFGRDCRVALPCSSQ